MNLDAKAHYFSCRRALADAERTYSARGFSASLRELGILREEIARAERACLEAESDWRFAEAAALFSSHAGYQQAFTTLMLARRVAAEFASDPSAAEAAEAVAAEGLKAAQEAEAILAAHLEAILIAEGMAA